MIIDENKLLDQKKVIFSEASLVDDFGRVFFYEGRVFRAIYKNQKDNCLAIIESNLYKELYTENLIPKTWITNYQLEGFSLILEHEFVYESKPHHWSFTMYKDAALAILEVNKTCNRYGYELKDAHPYNIFFKNNNPVFIDFGSISKRVNPSTWVAYEQFLTFCYLQLLVWNKADFFLARKLIEDSNYPALRTIPMSSIFDSFLMNLVKYDLYDFKLYFRGRLLNIGLKEQRYALILSKGVNRIGGIFLRRKIKIKMFTQTKELKNIKTIEEKLKSFERPTHNSYWENYHNTYKTGNKINSTPRFDRIIGLVKQYALNIKSAIDLAGNQGVFCYLLSNSMYLNRIILTDYDEKAIDIAYQTFKADKINIQPYLFNFMLPLRDDEIISLRSDIVFALAITHHLVLTQKYQLQVVFKRIESFSNNYVVIEFMPIGLWGGKEIPEVPEWYTVDWFRTEFKKQFVLLAEEQLEINRIVFIGKKFNNYSSFLNRTAVQ
jgi:hypothetical protein